jgi:hydroxyacyl-ACP dehydratase HTD2-like protein with hotdog domain
MDAGSSVITDEVRALVGVSGPVVRMEAPVGHHDLRRFVQAAMEVDPVHWDETAARERGYDGVVAPPLFPLHAFRQRSGTPDPLDAALTDAEWDGIELVEGDLPPLDLPLERLLNGGVEADVHQLARVGDVLEAQSRYASVTERKGRSGPMVFVVVETTYRNQEGDLLLVTRTTMIAR